MSGQKIPDAQERPNTARRAVLTGGAVGLAAVAGATLGRAQPASALTPPPSVIDWINVTSNGAAGDGVTDDTVAIQDVLSAAGPGQVVYLPGPTPGTGIVGTYLVSAPLTVPSGVILTGCSPAGELASGFNGMAGSILKVNGIHWSGLGVILFDGTSANVYNPVVKDLWIDFTAVPGVPANVHGIASINNVFHAVIDRVGMAGPTGIGINGQDSGGSSDRPDGWSVTNVIIERPLGHGVFYGGKDAFFCNVHVQNGNTGAGTGDGFQVNGGNNFFIACRADSCMNGFTIDVTPGAQFDDCVALVGCGTEANSQNGLNITNVSGTAYQTPVLVTGCHFDGDGVSGTPTAPFAGIAVAGVNTVSISNTRVMVRTSDLATGCPQYGLATAAVATGIPISIVMSSGFLGYVTGGVNDAANVGSNLIISPNVTSAAGLHPSALTTFPGVPLTLNGAYNTLGSAVSVTNTAPTSSPPINYVADEAADPVSAIRVQGDSNSRWQVDSNGRLQWGSGLVSPDVRLLRSSANLLAVQIADLDIITTGRGLRVAEGTNAKQGTATLSTGGTVTVSNASVTTTSRIFLTAQDNNTTGALRVSARIAGASFTIKSSASTDSGGTVAYEIFEQG